MLWLVALASHCKSCWNIFNKEMYYYFNVAINGISEKQLWKGRHHHHNYEVCITIVLIILYIAPPLVAFNLQFIFNDVSDPIANLLMM